MRNNTIRADYVLNFKSFIKMESPVVTGYQGKLRDSAGMWDVICAQIQLICVKLDITDFIISNSQRVAGLFLPDCPKAERGN